MKKLILPLPLSSLAILSILALVASLSPLPFPKTPIAQAETISAGDGTDGAVTISTAKNLNINLSDGLANHSRTCADGGDGVNYSVTALNHGAKTATLSATPSSGCLAAGDEVLLINLKGISANYANVGNYEFLTIQNVSTNTVTFTTTKTKYYGDAAGGDTNLGTADTNQRVMLQRVPNYTNVTFSSDGSLTATAWNGSKDGVIVLRANGTVTVNNTTASAEITASGLGFRSGTGVAFYQNAGGGETYNGYGGRGGSPPNDDDTSSQGGGGGACAHNEGCPVYSSSSGSVGGGGAGGGNGFDCNAYGGGGGGAGYGAVGSGGQGGISGASAGSGSGTSGGSGGIPSPCDPYYWGLGAGAGGGGTYGISDLGSKLYLGSGGGAGGAAYEAAAGGVLGGNGGNGGGIIFISADILTVNSGAYISSNGNSGSNGPAYSGSCSCGDESPCYGYGGSGGGGAGGSIFYLYLRLTNNGSITVTNGAGGTANYDGGSGGSGRSYSTLLPPPISLSGVFQFVGSFQMW